MPKNSSGITFYGDLSIPKKCFALRQSRRRTVGYFHIGRSPRLLAGQDYVISATVDIKNSNLDNLQKKTLESTRRFVKSGFDRKVCTLGSASHSEECKKKVGTRGDQPHMHAGCTRAACTCTGGGKSPTNHGPSSGLVGDCSKFALI